FFFSSRRRHTRSKRDWSSDVCSSDLVLRLKFHPQNVLVTVPSYELAIGDRGPAALDLRRTPVYTTGSAPKPGTSMYGATLEADRSEERRVGKACRTWGWTKSNKNSA